MKHVLRLIACGAALTFAATAVPSVMAMPLAGIQDRDRDHQEQPRQEWARNRYYRQGNREGYQDYQRKVQRPEHTHNYRNDDDRHAHDYGYQQGYQGQRGIHIELNAPR